MKKLVILLILIFAAVFGRNFRNKKTKETIAVDPALYDYFRIDKITLK